MAAVLLTAPAPDGPVIPVAEHYTRASWVRADRDGELPGPPEGEISGESEG